MTNMPHSNDLERAVLGAMLFEQEAIDIVMELITADVFYEQRHAVIFRTIADMQLTGEPVDQLTLTENLRKARMLGTIGGESAIAGLIGEIVGAANVGFHCRVLLDKYNLRRIISLVSGTRVQGEEGKIDAADLAAQTIDQLTAILDQTKSRPYQTISDAAHEAYGIIIQRAGSDKLSGVPSGLTRLDRMTDGFQPGHLIVIAGLTGSGKTALALNFLTSAAKCEVPIGMFSLEMNTIELLLRMFALESGVNHAEVRYTQPTKEQWERLAESASSLSRLPVVFDDTPGISLPTLAAKARKMQRDKGIKMIIVDYLQLMEGTNRESRQLEVASVSRGLKRLAKSMHIPIIAISQLSRKANESEFRRPQLSDLYESGAIEKDSDVVMFVYEPSPDGKKELAEGYTGEEIENIRELIIKKNRHGRTGTLPIYWNSNRLRFSELTSSSPMPPRGNYTEKDED